MEESNAWAPDPFISLARHLHPGRYSLQEPCDGNLSSCLAENYGSDGRHDLLKKWGGGRPPCSGFLFSFLAPALSPEKRGGTGPAGGALCGSLSMQPVAPAGRRKISIIWTREDTLQVGISSSVFFIFFFQRLFIFGTERDRA